MNKKIKFITLLLALGTLPVITAITILTMVSVNKLSTSLEDDVYARLKTATTGLKEYYGYDIVKNGSVEIEDDDSYVDTLKEEGIELTLFEGDTRVATSIMKDGSTTERNIGTQASPEIYEEVKAGNIVKKDNVSIGGGKYYVVYQPIYDGDGNFWGMSFAGESQEAVDSIVTLSKYTLITIAVLLIIIAIVLIVVVSNILKRPMVDAVNALNTLSSGDLNGIINTKSPILEIENMIDSTKSLQINLRDAIGTVKESANVLANAVSEVDVKVENTTESVSQINDAINEVADTSQTVSVSAQTLANRADELERNVEELTENTNVLMSEAEEIKKANNEASKYMNTVLESSNKSVDAVNSISKEIVDTNEAVEDIQNCVVVINEIASETKLLSLNASIEAARAGEAGRGFSVVAQNIKQLAESSSANVKKITTIIDKVTKLSDKSVKGAETVKSIIEDEQKYIIDAQDKFTILSNAVDNSVVEIQSISDKTKNLGVLKNSLVSETSDLSAVSEELGASAEQVSATCSSVNEMCQDNRAKTEEMRAINETLSEAVHFFK